MESLKDYVLNINYHPREANVVANALGRKDSSNLAYLITRQKHILEDFDRLRIEMQHQREAAYMAKHHNTTFIV